MKSDLIKEVLEDAKALQKIAEESARNTLLEHFTPVIKESVAAALGEADLELEMDGMPSGITEKEGEEMDMGCGDEETVEETNYGVPEHHAYGSADNMTYEAKGDDGDEVEIKIDDLKDDGEKDMPKEESLEITNEDVQKVWAELKNEVMVSKGFKEMADPNKEDGDAGLSKQKSGETHWKDIEPPDAKDYSIKENLVREIKKHQFALEVAARRLAEQEKVILSLRKNIHEATLFNHKLLYVNRLTRNPGLAVNFKEKIVEAMDRATTVQEAILVYESYKTAIANFSKNKVNEAKKVITKGNTASRVAGRSASLLNEGANGGGAEDKEKARQRVLAGLSKE